jgi:hypothetical protein
MEKNLKYRFNRNDKQSRFNEIKGAITEKNDGEEWCSITINVGHENPRLVNFSIKKPHFDIINEEFLLGNKVVVSFYLTSRFKNGRWYTIANALQVDAVTLD